MIWNCTDIGYQIPEIFSFFFSNYKQMANEKLEDGAIPR